MFHKSLDHERPLHQTCHRWRERLSGLDGLDGAALCLDLFGVRDSKLHGAACVRFVDHVYCHRS